MRKQESITQVIYSKKIKKIFIARLEGRGIGIRSRRLRRNHRRWQMSVHELVVQPRPMSRSWPIRPWTLLTMHAMLHCHHSAAREIRVGSSAIPTNAKAPLRSGFSLIFLWQARSHRGLGVPTSSLNLSNFNFCACRC